MTDEFTLPNDLSSDGFTLPKHGIFEEETDDDGQLIEHNLTEDARQANITYDITRDKTQVLNVHTSFTEEGRRFVNMRAKKSSWVHNLIYLNGQKFSFEGRDYLKQIYDIKSKYILLKTGRQVEKCVTDSCLFLKSSGERVSTLNLQVGDEVCSLDTTTDKMSTDIITAIGPNGKKPIIRITTRTKRSLSVTENHPLRKLLGWEDATNIVVGDYIALPQRAGVFGNVNEPDMAFIIGALLGDGSLPFDTPNKRSIFSQKDGDMLDMYISVATRIEQCSIKFNTDKRTGSHGVSIIKRGKIYSKIKELNMLGRKADEKEIPAKCFLYDQETTRQLLRGLWGTDGHCKNVSKSKIDLCYSTTSKKLSEDIQVLLLKFGIFSTIRTNKPTLYKKSNKLAYILRVTGRRSFQNFLNNVGPIPGKLFTLTQGIENSNTNKIPNDVNQLLIKYKKDKLGATSAYKAGLKISNKYRGYSYPKFQRFCNLYNTSDLWRINNSDIYWDQVVKVEHLDATETYGVETAKHHNFVTDGIISHNTTMLGNNLAIMCSIMPFFKCLYVSPSHVQTRTFSNEKLKPVLERSPLIRKYLQDSKVSTQVFEKGFTNGSFIFLRSAFLSADRSRGISSDLLCMDEIQDHVLSNVPVIQQCLSHSKHGFQLFAGTPKSTDNCIEILWESTSQNEWMVKCSGCNKYNYLDIKNIGLKGPICKYCGKDIDVTKGSWQSAKANQMWQGFRIPQLMVPWIAKKDSESWKQLVHQKETYPEAQFYNEVMGLSYDNASKPVSRADVLQNCSSFVWLVDPYRPSAKDVDLIRKMTLFAGIDWGEGNDGTGKDIMGKIRTASYTVLTIGGHVNSKAFKVIFMKRYEGREIDPDYIVRDVVNICQKMGVRMIGSDWGHGWGVNNQLFRLFGPQKCVQYMYLDKQKEVRKWDPIGYKMQLLRNHVMSEVFFRFKQQGFLFPPLESWEEFAKDMFSISTEYVEYQRKLRYVHRPSDPDDWFHSLVYCLQTANVFFGKRGM